MTPSSDPDAPLVFARQTASSTWTMSHVGASGTAIVGQVTEAQAQLGYRPEFPHSPDIGPVDAFTGTALAVTTVAIGVRQRDSFRFCRSLADPGN